MELLRKCNYSLCLSPTLSLMLTWYLMELSLSILVPLKTSYRGTNAYSQEFRPISMLLKRGNDEMTRCPSALFPSHVVLRSSCQLTHHAGQGDVAIYISKNRSVMHSAGPRGGHWCSADDSTVWNLKPKLSLCIVWEIILLSFANP